MEAVDLKAGGYVTFDYADDTVEEISTTSPNDAEQDKETEPEKKQ